MRGFLRLPLCAAVAAAVLALPAQAATVTGEPVVDITDFPSGGRLVFTTVEVMTTIAGILQVNVLGAGGGLFAYADLAAAPDPADEATAIADAFAFLGLPGATAIASTALTPLAETSSVATVWDVSEERGTLWIGDPFDPQSVAVIAGQVNMVLTNTTTTLQPFRLDVVLADGPVTGIPLPPGLLLLGAALATLLGIARRRRTAMA